LGALLDNRLLDVPFFIDGFLSAVCLTISVDESTAELADGERDADTRSLALAVVNGELGLTHPQRDRSREGASADGKLSGSWR
jgi:hypothetical protein